MPNSIDCHKRIFLHVIPVRIIVPWTRRIHSVIVKISSISKLYGLGFQPKVSFETPGNMLPIPASFHAA